LVVLPEAVREPAALRAAAAAGVWIEGLSAHRIAGEQPARQPAQTGLLLGYANLSEPAIQRGVALLAGAIDPLTQVR
jgi:DNA-binding transcriptional MocR family regulator